MNTEKVKVKCTLVQVLRLCTGRMTHKENRGIALLFHDHGTRREWGVSVTPWPLFTPGKDPVPIVQEAGWTPGPVWTGAESLVPTGIWSPDRPARSQSLYRLLIRTENSGQFSFRRQLSTSELIHKYLLVNRRNIYNNRNSQPLLSLSAPVCNHLSQYLANFRNYIIARLTNFRLPSVLQFIRTLSAGSVLPLYTAAVLKSPYSH